MEARFSIAREQNILNSGDTRVSGCDANNFSGIEDILEKLVDPRDSQAIKVCLKNNRPAEVATVISHLKAVKQAYDQGRKEVIVVEDDITFEFCPMWGRTLKDLIAPGLPEDTQEPRILQLSWSAPYAFVRESNSSREELWAPPHHLCCGAFSYYLNRAAMEAILSKHYRTDSKKWFLSGSTMKGRGYVSESIIFGLSCASTLVCRHPLFAYEGIDSTIHPQNLPRHNRHLQWMRTLYRNLEGKPIPFHRKREIPLQPENPTLVYKVGTQPKEIPLVGLVMICKNESHIVQQALNSVKDHIGYWILADNGSTDGSRELVRDFFKRKGIPGEVWADKWDGLSPNRSRALDLCQGKMQFAFMMDCDDLWETDESKVPEGTNPFEDLNKVVKQNSASRAWITLHSGDYEYRRGDMFRVSPLNIWKYEGVAHNFAKVKKGFEKHYLGTSSCLAKRGHVHSRRLGSRGKDNKKYQNNVRKFEAKIKENPGDTRSWFYLAESYKDSGNQQKAYDTYMKRSLMYGGYEEERAMASFKVAQIAVRTKNVDRVQLCRRAILDRPSRPESYFLLSQELRSAGRYREACEWAYEGYLQASDPKKTDSLFMSRSSYDWKMEDEFASAMSWIPEFRAMAVVHFCRLLEKANREKRPYGMGDRDKSRYVRGISTYSKAACEQRKHPRRPDRPMVPTMTGQEYLRYCQLLKDSKSVFEWGGLSEGNTLAAIEAGVETVVAVDSDPSTISKLRTRDIFNKVVLIHADLGPVGNHGVPKNDSSKDKWSGYSKTIERQEIVPDVVLVGGRFRVACMLRAALKAPQSTIVCLDYSKRKAYHIVSSFLDKVEPPTGRMQLFNVKENADRDAMMKIVREYEIHKL